MDWTSSDSEGLGSEDPDVGPSRPKRLRRHMQARPNAGDDADMDDSGSEDEYGQSAKHSHQLEVEIEEEKPKPVLRLSYNGFRIYGHCLCIVVEPWPPIETLPPTVSTKSSSRGTAPPGFRAPQDLANRDKTPLFLLDEDEDYRESFGQSVAGEGHRLDPLDEISHRGGMLEMSQVLRAVGDFPSGLMDDDNEVDGEVFFADADETREL